MLPLLPIPSFPLFKAMSHAGLVKRKVQVQSHEGQLSFADRWVLPTPVAATPAKTHQSAPKRTKTGASQMSLFGEGAIPTFQPKPRPKTSKADGGTLSLFDQGTPEPAPTPTPKPLAAPAPVPAKPTPEPEPKAEAQPAPVAKEGGDKIGVDEAHHYEDGKRVRGEGEPEPSEAETKSEPEPKSEPETKSESEEPSPSAPAPTPPAELSSLAHIQAHMDALHDGHVNAEAHKAAFESLQEHKDAVVAELRGKTKAELDKIAPPMWSGRKKDEAVKAAWNRLSGRFHLGDTMSYSPMSETQDEATARHVRATTDDDIEAYRARRKQAIADYKARVEAHHKALTNPETREEFDTFARVKGEANLSPEQREKYDELRGIAKRDQKREDEVARLARGIAAGKSDDNPGLKLVKHFHSKLGQDVHIATLDERVERDHFDRLSKLAKQFGGWYSRPWKGSPSGFAFKDEAKANQFMEAANPKEPEAAEMAGHAPTGSEDTPSAEQAPPAEPKTPEQMAREMVESRERDRQLNAASHLRGVADRLHDDAQGRMEADRKTNTARRVNMAENAEENAARDQQLAATMHSIAGDLEEGKSTHLAGVQHKTQVELLDELLRIAKWNHINVLRKRARDENNGELDDQAREMQKREPTRESIEHATMPHMYVTRYDLGTIAKFIEEHKIAGAMRPLAKIRKNCLYKPEWKEDGHVPIYRQDNLEALDSLLTAVEHSPHGAKLKYEIDRLRERRMSKKRLEAMGTHDEPSLRAALREFLPHRPEKASRNPIKQAERALVGKKIPGYFPTPAPLAQKMLDAADIRDGHRVLEPSAGKGSLADAVKERQPGAQVETIEPHSDLRRILEAKGHKVVGHDFMQHDGDGYDRIVMNPPFEYGQDADHVRRAFDKLKPGGRLVAITGEGIHFRSDAKSRAFRDWLDAHGGTAERLPDGSFKSSDNPTGVATRMVTLNKPHEAQVLPRQSEPGAEPQAPQKRPLQTFDPTTKPARDWIVRPHTEQGHAPLDFSHVQGLARDEERETQQNQLHAAMMKHGAKLLSQGEDAFARHVYSHENPKELVEKVRGELAEKHGWHQSAKVSNNARHQHGKGAVSADFYNDGNDEKPQTGSHKWHPITVEQSKE